MKKILIFILFILIILNLGCATPVSVSVTKAEEIKGLVLLTTFEKGETEGWQARGEGVKISLSDTLSHTGKFSLYVEGRSSGWHGAQIQLKDLLKPGKTYNISIWVFQRSGAEQQIVLTMQRRYSTDDKTNYDWVKALKVPSDTWTELAGSYSIPKDVSIIDLTLYVEAPQNVTLSYYIDDLVIVEQGSAFRFNPELISLISRYISK